MQGLSERTWNIVQKMYPLEKQQEVGQLLVAECGNNLPFCDDLDEGGLERIRFSVLKLSKGKLDALRKAIQGAQVDWRDILMAGGLAVICQRTITGPPITWREDNLFMRNAIPFFILVIVALRILCPSVAQETGAAIDSQKITEITLKRTWCYGVCPVDEVVLHADGTAHYSGTINTRRVGHYQGGFWTGDFEKLAQWFQSQGFFGLKDKYGSPNIDISDHIVSVVRAGKRKTVVNHSIDSSLAVWGMESAIRGVMADVAWKPVSSGIRGVVTWRPRTSSEFPGPPAFRPLDSQTVLVKPEGESQAFRLQTDKEGKFEICLRPGTYSVEIPNFGRNPQTANPQKTVIVQPEKISDMTVAIDRLTN
jgi:hypothetical protein